MNNNWRWQPKGCKIMNGTKKVAEVNVAYCDSNELNRRGKVFAAAPNLLRAAEKILAHLHGRIERAGPASVPVFEGIAELHDAINKATK